MAKSVAAHGRPVADDTARIIEEVLRVFDEVAPPLTVRQVFYQLASRLVGLVPLTKGGYRKAQRILLKVRELGIVPWEHFADRTRERIRVSVWDDAVAFAGVVASAYRKDYWTGQPTHVEFWLEKDALSGFVKNVLDEYQVPLYVARGYSSATFVHEGAAALAAIDKPKFVYYLGDHDPSGADLERDVRAKLARYGAGDFAFKRLAIHLEDIARFGLQPLEAKSSDSRYSKYVAAHGERTIELDALPPDEMRQRIRGAVVSHIVGDEWQRMRRTEEIEQASIKGIAEKMRRAAEKRR